MNFYKHHIGDYAQATAHLSFVEDAAYSRMLRKYYAEEKPLPADLKAVQRLVGARTKEEREAVELVLDEFFKLEADGWHNKRADAELAKAGAQAETNRRIAEEREAKRRARQASNETSTNRAVREHEPLHESFASREPSQTPDTRHQTPRGEGIDPSPSTSREPTPRGAVGMALKRAGIDVTRLNLADPRLQALIDQGATPEEFEGIAREAVQEAVDKPLGWICTVLTNRRAKAAALQLQQGAPTPATKTDRIGQANAALARRLAERTDP